MRKKQALLVGDLGDHFINMISTVSLLKRSGFNTDLVTNNPISKKIKSINNCIYVDKFDELPLVSLNQAEIGIYDLIVILDDFSLMKIRDSNLSNDEKLVLLPVTEKEHFQHIGSKIFLSLVLRQHGIKTPDFSIAHNKIELHEFIKEIDYPALIKIDFSSAGSGIFECHNKKELESVENKIDVWPVLLQKKLNGKELDLSAFYQNSELIHFSYSNIGEEREFGKFSPSVLRTYTQLGKLESDIFNELKILGCAIGANGFVNITCMQSEVDQQRYFFEADMRPNIWVNYPRYFGDDPAVHIFNYFTSGKVIKYPYAVRSEYPDQIVLPYFSRIKLWELAINRYNSWSYLPDTNPFLIIFVLAIKEIKGMTRRLVKPLVPIGVWLRLKQAYDTALRKLIR